jgi:hypothetical protein
VSLLKPEPLFLCPAGARSWAAAIGGVAGARARGVDGALGQAPGARTAEQHMHTRYITWYVTCCRIGIPVI